MDVNNIYDIYGKDLLFVHFSEMLDMYLNNCNLPFEPLFEEIDDETSEESDNFSSEILPYITRIPKEGKTKEGRLKEQKERKTESDEKYKLIRKRIDRTRLKPGIRDKKDPEVFVDTLKNFKKRDLRIPFRSGAILYTKFEGKTYFCLGLDAVYGELTDFAGGVKKDEDIISGGLRELKEESFGVFGNIKYEEIKDCTGVYCINMLIMFLPVKVDMKLTEKIFKERMAHHKDNHYRGEVEVSSLVWIEKKDFLKAIDMKSDKRMYLRVQKMLSQVHVKDTILTF